MKKKDVEEMIKPEVTEVIKTEKTEKVKESKEAKVSKVSSDAKVIFGIVAGMIIICAALIFYYFYGVNNQIIATYEGGKVTRGEYEVYYKLFQPMLSYYGYDEDAIKTEVLNKIVIDEIVLEKAKKDEVEISEDAKKEIEDIFEDEEQVNSYVEQGIDPEKMKDVYYDDALITAYIEKLTGEATEEKIKKFIDEKEGDKANYNKYTCSYILYANTGEDGDLEKVKANAQATLDRIKKGEGFATVGEEVQAADSTNIQYGSEYSVYLNGTSVSAFEDALRTMKAGDTTQTLVESEEYGYFIIRVESIAENARINSDDAADNYVNELLAKWQSDAKIDANEKKLDKVAASLTTTAAS